MLAAFGIASFPAHAANSINYSFSGVGGAVSGTVFDTCSFTEYTFGIAQQGSHGVNAPSATPSAYAVLYNFNWCTYSGYIAVGNSDSIEFSAPGAANGNKMPQSLSASGVIPLNCVFGNCTDDSVTFSLTETPIAATWAQQLSGTEQSEYGAFWLPGKPTATRHMRYDQSQVPANATIAFSTQSLGQFQGQAGGSSSVWSIRQHSVTITY